MGKTKTKNRQKKIADLGDIVCKDRIDDSGVEGKADGKFIRRYNVTNIVLLVVAIPCCPRDPKISNT